MTQEATMSQPNETPNPQNESPQDSPGYWPGVNPSQYSQSSPTYPSAPAGYPVSGSGQRPMQPMTVQDERNWAVGAHLSSFVAAWLALGFLGPLTVMLLAGPRSPYVRRHAVEALNFNLSVLIYTVISALLVIVVIGIPMLIAIGAVYLVAIILGAVAASRGEDYRYPLTIRFVK
jgi:uncharacterized Tic20 family protein